MTPLYGELLILSILAICCLRTYFVTNTRLDALALFAPFGLLLNILQIINWGFNITEIIILFISILVFITNYRSFIRFLNRLYVDSYNTPFIVASSTALVLIGIMAVVCIINRPNLLSPSKYNVTVEKVYYDQQSDGSFERSEALFSNRNLRLTVYSPEEETASISDTVILFVPDKRASTIAYQPYLVLLAKQGYKIYYGEFGFSTIAGLPKFRFDQWQRFKLTRESRKAESDSAFFSGRPEYYDAYAREFEILSKIADTCEDSNKKFAIVGDGASGKCFDRIRKTARPVKATFNLGTIPEYKTSGYGFIEYTDPLNAKIHFGVTGNKSYFVPSYSVTKTKNAIEAAQ